VFLSFTHPDRTAPVLRAQLGKEWEAATLQIDSELTAVRQSGYAYSVGEIVPGRQCISAPLLSFDDQIVAAVSVVSTAPNLTERNSLQVLSLLDFCKRHSLRKRSYAEETLIERKIAV